MRRLRRGSGEKLRIWRKPADAANYNPFLLGVVHFFTLPPDFTMCSDQCFRGDERLRPIFREAV